MQCAGAVLQVDLQPRQSFGRRRTRSLVDADSVDFDDLAGELGVGNSVGRASLRPDGELVELIPGESPSFSDPVGGFELSGELVVLLIARGLCPAKLGQKARRHRHLAHRLHAAGDRHVNDAACDQSVGQCERLLGRTAL